MAISRPFLLALLGVALLGATVFAVQNARNTAADDATPVAEQTPAVEETAAPEPSAESSSAEPAQLLETALSADVESAAFDARLSFRSGGQTNVIRAAGAFVDNGAKEMPEVRVQMGVRVAAMNLNESGGFVTTGDGAWFTRDGAAYAVPRDIWRAIVDAREEGGTSESPELDVDPESWLKSVEEVGTDQVGGVEATHLRAEVDSAKALTDVFKAMSEAGGSPVPLPNAEQRLRQSGLTDAELHVWVGDDEIFRRITLDLSGRGDGNRRVDGSFSLQLSDVNEPQRIARPAKVRAGLPGGAYGQAANGLLAGVASGVGLQPEELNIGAPVTNSHLKAERAVADNRKVVIFFQNPRAHDDRATANAVRELDRRTGAQVVVLEDYLENVDRYGTLLEDLGVNQAPAIVVIGRSGEASLVEGYIDAETLTQVVTDAR